MEPPRKSSMETRKPNNYVEDKGMYAEGTLALILRLCRCAGVAPLRLSASRARTGWRFDASAPIATLQAVAMTVVNLTMLGSVIVDFYLPPSKRIRAGDTVLQGFVWVSDVVLVMVIASVVSYRGQAQMRSLQRVLRQLQQIKFDLNISRPPAKTEKVIRIAMVITLIWMVLVILSDFVVYCIRARSRDGTTWTIMLFYGVYYIADLQGSLAVLKWAFTARAVNECAAALNHHLQRLRHSSELLTLPSQSEALIRSLILSHERISEIVREINDSNGLFVMTTLMSTFLRLVLTPYYMLVPQTDSASGLPLSLNWTLVLMVTLVLIIEPCHWTHTQRKLTSILLGQLIVHLAPKCERLSKELDQFAKQLVLGNAEFAILDFYTLDRPLMATILGGVTTYLVIIIQFQTISNQL